MALQLTERPGRADYIASSGQTAFAVPFEFQEPSDLMVYRQGLLLTLAVAPANASEYSVAGAAVPITDGGGTITLGAPGAAAGNRVAIVSNVQVRRLTDFPLTGPFRTKALNLELERVYALLRQIENAAEVRGLQAPASDPPVSLILPPAAARALHLFAWGPNGEPIVGPLTSTIALAAAAVIAQLDDGVVVNLTVGEDAYIAGDLLVGGTFKVIGDFIVDGGLGLLEPLPLTSGGTGAATAAGGRTALGLGTASLLDVEDIAFPSLGAILNSLAAMTLAVGDVPRADSPTSFTTMGSTATGRSILNIADIDALKVLLGAGVISETLAVPGHVHFANGFKIQWGTSTTQGDTIRTVNYEIAFTDFAVPVVSGYSRLNNSSAEGGPSVNGTGLTSFTFYSADGATNNTGLAWWIAVGK